MSLIDTSYFFGDCQIGQLSEQSVQDKVTWFINQYEPEILQALLGYDTYNAFTKGLAVTPIDPKWTNLKLGVEYVDIAGFTKKWRGLAPAVVGSFVESPIAYYVYYKIRKKDATNTGGVGENETQSQNSVPVSPAQKMVTAWNRMVTINRELFDFMYAKQSDYPDWFSKVFTRSGMFGAYRQLQPSNFLTPINRLGT